MNGYKCYYKNKVVETQAETSYEAQKNAAVKLGVSEKNRYKITVVLCEIDGVTVKHDVAELDNL